jgi:hypothetical protein
MPDPDRGPGDEWNRGQVSLSVVEAAVGLVVVLAAATTFLVGLPGPGLDEGELTVLAADGLVALDATPPSATGDSQLTALVRDPSGFVRERDAADARLRALYPPHVRYRLATPHGALGDPLPADRSVGVARRHTRAGDVTLRVWYR